MLEAEITAEGDVLVEGHRVGHLDGFRFAPDSTAEGTDAKAVRNAAAKSLASEIETRAEKLSKAANSEFALASDGTIRWLGQAVAKLAAGPDALSPAIIVLADEQLTGPAKEKVDTRLALWVKAHIDTLLKPLVDLRDAQDLEGMARGIAFQLVEALGVLERQHVAEEVKALDQPMRAGLRKYGVRFGAYHIFLPLLLKPAPSGLIAQLWSLKNGNVDVQIVNGLHQLSMSGRTSIPVDKTIPKALYKVVGYRVCGERAVRIDILERLADLVRPLIAWKPLDPTVTPPDGAVAGGGGFTVTVAMTSLVGCSGEDFASILKSLGYRLERRKVTRPLGAAAKAAPSTEAEAETGATEAEAEAGATEAETETVATESPAGDDVPADDFAETDARAEGGTDEPGADVASHAAEVAETLATFAATESDTGPDGLAAAEATLVAALEPAETSAEPAESGAEPAETEVAVSASDASASDAAVTTADAEDLAPPPTDPASEPASPAEAAEAVATEQIEIEIWRPGRFERREHGPRGGRDQRQGQGPRGPRQGGGEGQAAREGRPQGEGRGDRPRGERSGQGQERGERPQGDRPHGERREGRPDRPPQEPRKFEIPRDGWKNRPGAGRPEGGPQGPRGGAPRDDRSKRPEKPLDPDSPFAKLAALKAELESKGKK